MRLFAYKKDVKEPDMEDPEKLFSFRTWGCLDFILNETRNGVLVYITKKRKSSNQIP